MIYLSAQPDDYYFLWQLQLQLFNFNRLGIKPSQIHVLVGYHKERGLANYFTAFFKSNKQAQFYAYPDNRKQKKYLSSLRPHIIAQHFKKYPALQQEHIFYHDSDIIFNRLPDFETLNKDEIWYASNTDNYTNIGYIEHTAGHAVFLQMCRLVGVAPELVKANDHHMGGAQYLLKKVPYQFWRKLERDCEKLYPYLNRINQQKAIETDNLQTIQAWCADMWCLWWQAMQVAKVATHPSLDFTWADSASELNEEKHILHYTGKVVIEREDLFRKGNYVYCSPFDDDFSKILATKASVKVVEEINRYNKHQLNKQRKLKDLTLIIPLQTESLSCLEKAKVVVKYLYKYFSCRFIIACRNEGLVKESIGLVDENIVYISHGENDFNSFIKDMIVRITTSKFGLIPQNLILPVNVLKRVIIALNHNEAVVMNNILTTDRLMQGLFAKSYDIKFLAENHGKLNVGNENLVSLFALKCNPNLNELLDTYLNKEPFTAYNEINFLNDKIYAFG